MIYRYAHLFLLMFLNFNINSQISFLNYFQNDFQYSPPTFIFISIWVVRRFHKFHKKLLDKQQISYVIVINFKFISEITRKYKCATFFDMYNSYTQKTSIICKIILCLRLILFVTSKIEVQQQSYFHSRRQGYNNVDIFLLFLIYNITQKYEKI